MIPDDTTQQTQIITEVSDPSGTVATLMTTLWAIHEDQGLLDWRLRYQYVKRAALDLRLAEEQASTNITVEKEFEDAQGQRFLHLQTMRADCQAEIVRLEALLRGNRTPLVGQLAAVSPDTRRSPLAPNADADRYAGSPYSSGLRRG